MLVLRDLAVRSWMSFACVHQAIIVLPWNDQGHEKKVPMCFTSLTSSQLKCPWLEFQSVVNMGSHEIWETWSWGQTDNLSAL